MPQNTIATLPEETALSACPLGNDHQSNDSSGPNGSLQPMGSNEGLGSTLTLDVSLPLEIFASPSSVDVHEVSDGAGQDKEKEKEPECVDGTAGGRKLKQQRMTVSERDPFILFLGVLLWKHE